MLVSRGRLALSLEVEHWWAVLASHPAVKLLPLDPAVGVAATRLPEPFHADPFDRFLVAKARGLGVPPLSADSKATLNRRHFPMLANAVVPYAKGC